MNIYTLFVIQNNTNYSLYSLQVTLLSPTCTISTISMRLVIIFSFIFAICASDKEDNLYSFCRTIERIVFIFHFITTLWQSVQH